MSDSTLQHVDLTFHYASDRNAFAIQAVLQEDGNWSQWGQPSKRLSRNVEIMDALGDALAEALSK